MAASEAEETSKLAEITVNNFLKTDSCMGKIILRAGLVNIVETIMSIVRIQLDYGISRNNWSDTLKEHLF